MHGLRNVLARSRVMVAALALWPCLTDCGGKAFEVGDKAGGAGADGSEGGGASATPGGSASGGKAGSESKGGDAAGGSGAAAGTPSGACQCSSGEYCRDASHDCKPCSDVTRMHFTTPEPLATLSDAGRGSRFPRPGATRTDLLYRFDGVGLRYTSDSSTSPGSSLTATDVTDSAPLLLSQMVSGDLTGKSFDFLFDRAEPNTPRAIFSARWDDEELEHVTRAPAPFNGDAGDYSIAVALGPLGGQAPRAFWMSNRGSSADPPQPTLLTAALLPNAPSEPVSLSVGRSTPVCPPHDAEAGADPDLTPWVTNDGSLLLFSTTRLDGSCHVAGAKKDIYAVSLQPELGQPVSTDPNGAQPLLDVNSSEDETDPSLSADLCELYFASNRGGSYTIYRARRR